MTKDNFLKLLNLMREQDELTSAAQNVRIDLIDFVEPANYTISLLLGEAFTEEGADLIFWYLYDNVEHVITETIKGKKVKTEIKHELDLFNYLQNRGYLKRDNEAIRKENKKKSAKSAEEFGKIFEKLRKTT